MNPIRNFIIVLCCGAVWGLAFYQQCFQVMRRHFFECTITMGPDSIVYATASVILGILAAYLCYTRVQPSSATPFLSLLLLLPSLARWQRLILADTIVFILVSATFVALLLRHQEAKPCKLDTASHVLPLTLLSVLVLLFTGFAMALQAKYYYSLELGHSDFCIFWNILDNSVNGDWFYDSKREMNFLNDHFTPSGFILMAPLYALFPRVETMFFFNGFALSVGAIFVYLLARQQLHNTRIAVELGIAFLLYPSLSRLVICGTYGFHLVHIAIPLLLAIAYCDAKRWRITTLVLVVIVMLVQETMAITLFGLGVSLFWIGRKKDGWRLAAAAALYFFLTLWIIPKLGPLQQYMYVDRCFSHLGSSTLEVILSPLLKPGVYAHYLGRREVLYFIALLLTPLAFLPLCGWRMTIAVLPVLVFICVQESSEVISINMQYQSQIVPVLFIALIHAAHSNPTLRKPYAMRALLTASIFSSFFYGHSFYTRENAAMELLVPDYRQYIQEVQTIIPPGASVTASYRLAAHFVNRNPLRTPDQPFRETDYILLDVDHVFSRDAAFHDYRKWVHESGRYRIIATLEAGENTWIIFQKGPPTPRECPADLRWEQLPASATGPALSLSPHLFCHGVDRTEIDKNQLELTLYLEVTMESDVDSRLQIVNRGSDGKTVVLSDKLLASGRRPLFICRKGDRVVHRVRLSREEMATAGTIAVMAIDAVALN